MPRAQQRLEGLSLVLCVLHLLPYPVHNRQALAPTYIRTMEAGKPPRPRHERPERNQTITGSTSTVGVRPNIDLGLNKISINEKIELQFVVTDYL
jgi:hypothetical protein